MSKPDAPRLFARFWLHITLMMFAVIFLFPFAWMILTSAKTDEELAAGKWLPAMPVFRASSPYESIDSSGRKVTASLELLQLQVRSQDAQIFNVISGKTIAEAWKVESGEASLVEAEAGAVVKYHFSSSASPQVVLRYDFAFPCDPDNLHKLILSLTADDSWHRVDAELLLNGDVWKSSRPTYLAQTRATSILFQPPTFDDETYQPKIWIPLKCGTAVPDVHFSPQQHSDAASQQNRVNSASSVAPRDDRATLRIIISPSSTPRAVYGKLSRNFIRIFNSIPFWQYLRNSLILVVLTVVGTLISSTFVAYAFARLHWPGRSVALLILLMTLMLPEQVTMIPSFLIWQKIGWYNTLNPIWAPTFVGATFTPLFGSAFFIYLMVQHMKTLPRELEEAARIDGLSHVQTWYYIMLPQVKPAAAAIAVLSFLAAWNDFLRPLIYLRDQSRFPLSLGMLAAQIENRADWTLIMAGNVLMTLPVILIFFLCQRYFVQGMTMSGMKG